ncbi:MAG TPA: hypothetical protein VLK65_11565 [Vicinamibacteria bacterium]|nr:hypothetical protein [Vicinamibacteria bacterium]
MKSSFSDKSVCASGREMCGAERTGELHAIRKSVRGIVAIKVLRDEGSDRPAVVARTNGSSAKPEPSRA